MPTHNQNEIYVAVNINFDKTIASAINQAYLLEDKDSGLLDATIVYRNEKDKIE